MLFGSLAIYIFATDVILTFNTACYISGVLTKDRIDIAKHYIKTSLFYDLISIVSIYLVVTTQQKIYNVFFIVRALQIRERLGKLNTFYQINDKYPVQYEITLLFFIILIMAHIFGCGFYFVGSFEKENSRANWIDFF